MKSIQLLDNMNISSQKTILGAIVLLALCLPFAVLAGPASENYELQTYSFGAGGTTDAASDGYGLLGILGETGGAQSTSDGYALGAGLVFINQADVPPAPIFTNPGSTYDRLRLIIETGGNPPDAEFAVAITNDDWTTTRYVQDDFTVGDTLGVEDWLTYADWNSASGRYITGLANPHIYQVQVKARHGAFTESGWGPVATAETVAPSLSFGVDTLDILFSSLSPGNSFTDSSKSTILTTSTNAYNGYAVYVRETGPLTSGASTIPDYASPNSAPTTWTGTGFGYTTNDNNLAGGTADRFTNGGPNFAGFTTAAPGDPVADHREPVVESPITNQQFTASYRVTGSATMPAGTYQTSILYIVVPEF